MVIAQLIGGLGNQMFQYAAARALAETRRQDLFLHLSRLSPGEAGAHTTPSTRHYGLDVFAITGRPISVEELLQHGVNALWTLTETGAGFHPELKDESVHHRNVGLMGWWQSANYFEDIAPVIREEFTFRDDYCSPHDPSVLGMIADTDSICIHVRRTDYLRPEDPVGFLGSVYYERAVEDLATKLSQPHIFVFSDDITWCREHLKFRFPTIFVSNERALSQHAADDLYVMSRCKHFIIANSTYSWWAAWLGSDAAKIVIAPKAWFRSERGEATPFLLRSDHLIPDNWIRL